MATQVKPHHITVHHHQHHHVGNNNVPYAASQFQSPEEARLFSEKLRRCIPVKHEGSGGVKFRGGVTAQPLSSQSPAGVHGITNGTGIAHSQSNGTGIAHSQSNGTGI
eukprot:PhF_6_TR6224/c0_g1_i3/m.9395